ncbi:MAG TPA: hypothetical protein VJT73_16175 [Polyangiaceae bacterium]|nr:hypothetical protein [Polyangiaceae bacterium]
MSGVFNGMRVDFSDALSGFYSVSKDQTLITAHLPGTKVGEGTGLKLFVRGKMAGSFSCGDEPDGGLSIGMGYSWTQGLTYNADYATTNSASATPCSIVIASYGAVGARLSGTFSGGLIAIGRTGPSATDPPQHMRVANGTFDLVRGADIP